MAYRPHTFASCFGKFSLTLAMVLYLCIDVSVAQVLQHKKPSEVLIKEYEKLVANGSLLTPEGWARASKLFEQSDQYPPEGEIQLVSAPGIIGETALSGDHAEVWTKWGTSYGTIDSHLRYRAIPTGGSVMLGESFSLVLVHRQGTNNEAAAADSGEWKIEGPRRGRAASIPAAIRYLQDARNKSQDPVVRKNAGKTINLLRHLSTGCGVPNPC